MSIIRVVPLFQICDETGNRERHDQVDDGDAEPDLERAVRLGDDELAAAGQFEKIKAKFYEEVVYAENAPDIEEYKTYYESIEPQTAERLYKQVVSDIQQNEKLKDYIATYSSMKPAEAATIFNTMTKNLKLVAKILNGMDKESRGKILGKMDADTAAAVTKLMDPD